VRSLFYRRLFYRIGRLAVKGLVWPIGFDVLQVPAQVGLGG
jgi:hypothetical protein